MDNTTAIIVAIVSSTGLWTLLQTIFTTIQAKKHNKAEDVKYISKGLLAVLHERLYALCDKVIDQTYITQEQLENLTYMKEPYFALGGDGTLEKMINIIEDFEIKKR